AAQTGLGDDVYLEQLYTFGSPRRDPHGRVVSVAYVALTPAPMRPDGRRPGDHRTPHRQLDVQKYTAVAWRRVSRLPPLAYDHRAVVKAALARLRAKLTYTNLAYTLLPRAFTLGELQEMYEAILGRRLDRRNFRKKIRSLGLLRPLAQVRRGSHRPARLHTFQRRRPMIVEIL